MNLIPGTAHAITWSKQNLQDATTYYVRAVIRDVRTETILDTIDLDDVGGGRYRATWNVPQDGSGRGREIEIEKTIYEDSGYTQVSGMYGRWLDSYLIFDPNRQTNTGGFGGMAIDYTAIRRIISEEVAGVLKNQPKTEVDLSALVEEMGGVKQSLGERVRELFRLGQKADAIETLERSIADKTTNFEKKVETMTKDLADAINDAISKINDTVERGSSRIVVTAERSEKNLSEKTDEELTHIVGQFEKIMTAKAETIAKNISDSVEEQLSRPIKLQSVQEYNAVREKTPTTNPRQDRINQLNV